METAISGLVVKNRLTGQYAFDYFREEASGRFFVIECNPRASSVMEGVSGTPGWGASFFGKDVRCDTQYQNVGFWFHRNCWPFDKRRTEGFWSIWDPLPVIVAEIAWPLEMLRVKGALKGGSLSRAPKGIPIEAGIPLTARYPALLEASGLNYHHIDVNIGKVIVPGRTTGRDFAVFEEIAREPRAAFLRSRLQRYGPEPRVLCDDTEIAMVFLNMTGCRPVVTRLASDPAEMMRACTVQGQTETVILGCPTDALRTLAQLSKSFDAIFLPEAVLPEVSKSLVAASGCVMSLESLPAASTKRKEA